MPDTPVGTNSPDYTLVTADLSADIYCKVTATNASGSANADSNTVGPVTAASSGVFVYIADSEGQGDDSIVTSAIDTTGADYLFVVMNDNSANATISDSKGNVWDNSLAPNGTATRIWQCHPTSVGSGHTVTLTYTGPIYAAACFLAFSGGATGEYDASVANADAPPVPITPVQNNSLILSIAYIETTGGGSSTIDESFIKVCDLPRTGQFGLAVAYLIQTTAAEVSPTWTISGGVGITYSTAVFSNTPLAMAKPSPES